MISLLMDSKKWDEAAEASYFPFVSYKFGWLQSIGLSFPHLRPLPLAKIGEGGIPEYICPCFIDRKKKAIVSSAFLAPGFVNKNVDPREMVERLISSAKREHCRKISLQIPPGYHYSGTLLSFGFDLVSKVCFFNIETGQAESFEAYLQTGCSRGRRSDIHSSLRKGLGVEILSPSPEALDRFYSVYRSLAERKNIDVFEKAFIDELSRSLSENARFWIVKANGTDIGSALTFEFKDRIWGWLAHGEAKFADMKIGSFLYAEQIRYAFQKKIGVIDFGTSELGSSLADFKRRFGAEPVFHEVYELDLSLLSPFRKAVPRLKRIISARFLRNNGSTR